ncbi:ABC transporter substrate-binding protein [Variovorax paradoxus]|jgi:tripartite ATP-independent transporter DctP family solute receptor|uniref:TRAP transporter substrate-binding protein n=1 Tax=Variovorax TaxID=34072 RepID=UPI0006E5D6DF|nr:ABC transporter substrate-binding protein [Variovorax paradoxus]KPV12486.1 ABC transporter substrate-binding protein [Variovorax paradoxus]KPV12750.1 ABC transporter substrate-binding protein [Variovorax paradoxus]KPV24914.1 ABC transporter substrate-binding protein [Variovorax paradoxus]KPV35912.1 ABC transporter substrate-binding protein [Variovorax paradoxus]
MLKKIIVALAATAALGLAHAQAGKFGYGASDDNSQGLAAKRFSELVKTRTGGRVNVNTYGSGKLGTDAQMQSALQGGVQELMVGPTSGLVGVVKEYALLDLPFLVSSFKEADSLLDGPVGQSLFQKLEAHGLVGLAYWENGFRHLTNSRRPVNKLEDIAGLKIRVIPNPVYIETFKALGANPLPLPYTELYGALETKSVDAQENGLGLIESGKFYEVQKYLTLSAHSYTPYIVLASKKWFDKLSEADRDVVRKAAVDAGTYQRQINREETRKLVDQMKKHGLQVVDLPAAEANRMREKVKPVHEKFTEQIGAALMKQAREEIAKAAQ